MNSLQSGRYAEDSWSRSLERAGVNELEDAGDDASRGFVGWAKCSGQGQMLEAGGGGGMPFRRPCCDSGLHLKDVGTLKNFLPGQVPCRGSWSRAGPEQKQGDQLEAASEVDNRLGTEDPGWGVGWG